MTLTLIFKVQFFNFNIFEKTRASAKKVIVCSIVNVALHDPDLHLQVKNLKC